MIAVLYKNEFVFIILALFVIILLEVLSAISIQTGNILYVFRKKTQNKENKQSQKNILERKKSSSFNIKDVIIEIFLLLGWFLSIESYQL